MAITKVSNSGIKSGMTKYDSFLAGNAAYDPGSYWLIERVTAGSGGSSSLTFNSIPSTYKHLQLRMIVRSTQSGTGNGSNLYVRFNSDSNTNYTYHFLKGNGSTVSAVANTARTMVICTFPPKDGETSGLFGTSVLDILDYTNTNKYTTVRHLDGYDANGNGEIFFYSNLWLDTSAITSITVSSDSGNLAQYSTFALYGIKG